MLSTRALALGASAVFLAGSVASAQMISDLYNTGVDNAGDPLPGDVDDPHYAITVDPSGLGDATIPADGFPISSWMANDANSAWIGPNNNTDANDGEGPAGTYVYETTFTLPANADLTTVSIAGRWATDDGGLGISVNGVDTGNPASGGFSSYTTFSINDANANFVAGTNTLSFSLNNGGGPTGLRVDDMVGSYDLVPEPATLSVLALGGIGLLARRRHA